MKTRLTIIALFCISLLGTGCSMYSARFSPPVNQETNVVLKENDFNIIERNLEGSYGYLSLAVGQFPFFAVEFPLGDPRLFSNALADLYMTTKQKAEGKPSQLVNWTLDNTTWFIPIPYISPVVRNVTFRTDLMEFTK